MRRIGVLGGSFDPVHRGHISLAKDALIQAALDCVVFVPVHRQPFKLEVSMASDQDRLAMLHEAIVSEPAMEISDWELNQEGISYTYLTLRALQEKWPEGQISFITGTDTFLKIILWKNAKELLEENSIIVGHRPGYREQELWARVAEIEETYRTRVNVINNTRLDISATEIRSLVAKGESISHLVPEGVERYIKTHGLYL